MFSFAVLTKSELLNTLTVFDLKRLDSYANNMVDYHLILDILPHISSHYFLHRLGETSLSPVQQGILAGLGLQRKSVDVLEKELSLPSSQILALFNKVVRKVSQAYRKIQQDALLTEGDEEDEKEVKAPAKPQDLKRKRAGDEEDDDNEDDHEDDAAQVEEKGKKDVRNQEHWEPLETTLQDDLHEAGNEVKKMLKEQQRKLLDTLDMQQ